MSLEKLVDREAVSAPQDLQGLEQKYEQAIEAAVEDGAKQGGKQATPSQQGTDSPRGGGGDGSVIEEVLQNTIMGRMLGGTAGKVASIFLTAQEETRTPSSRKTFFPAQRRSVNSPLPTGKAGFAANKKQTSRFMPKGKSKHWGMLERSNIAGQSARSPVKGAKVDAKQAMALGMVPQNLLYQLQRIRFEQGRRHTDDLQMQLDARKGNDAAEQSLAKLRQLQSPPTPAKPKDAK